MWIHKIINYKFFKFNLLEILLFFAIFTIPFGNNFNSLAIILFCVGATFQNSWSNKKSNLEQNLLWALPLLLFFIFLASIMWDPNGIGALKSIEKKTSFLFLPAILASVQRFDKKILQTAFLFFVLSVLIVCLCCIIKSTFEYFSTKDYRVFFYQYLSKQMHLNAIYLSLYCTFCLYIIMFFGFIKPGLVKFLQPFPAFALCLFFCSFILLFSSKTVIFISLFFIIATALYLSYKKRQLLKGIFFILFIFFTGGGLIWNAPYLKWRIQATLPKQYEGQDDNQNGLAVRQKLWETSIKLIKQKPVLGYGVKYANERLVEEYRKENFQIAAENKYNSHNTYLQILLNAGILGFIPLITLLISSIVLAIKRRNYLFFMFITTVIALGITEAIFEGQKGIVFIVLFLFLFIYHFTTERAFDDQL